MNEMKDKNSFLTGLAGASALAFVLFILPGFLNTTTAPTPAPTSTTQQ